jgi:hypothetical protein
MMKKSFLSLLLLYLCGTPFLAAAAGISVTPSSLVYYLPVKTQIIKKITVENSFKNPQIYEVYSDELTDLVAITPGSFRLEPGEKQEVQIAVKSAESGNFATFISVVAADINRRQFNAATGAKIPLQITVLTSAPTFFQKNLIWFIIIICFLILLLDILIIAGLKKKLTWHQKIRQSIKIIIGKIWRPMH